MAIELSRFPPANMFGTPHQCRKQSKPAGERRRPGRHKNVIEIMSPSPSDPGEKVMTIMTKLQITKDNRQKQEVKIQLECILDRIKQVSGCTNSATWQ